MFPSRPWRLSPTDSLPRTDGRYSEFGWSREFPPFPIQCSTPDRLNREADPRAISGRASYHQARLAFHRYPQVIPWFCTTNGFGPPAGLTPPSPCPWVDRLASGLWPVTHRPVRTRFRCGSAPEGLSLATDHNSPAHTAKGMQSPFSQGQKAKASRLLLPVSGRFHALFHSPPGVLFTFPSRYWCAIGQARVFSLTGWSRQIQTGFHVPRLTWVPVKKLYSVLSTGLSPSTVDLPRTFDYAYSL